MDKREKKPGRLAWFAMDVDAFDDDPRMLTLTNKERSFWLFALIRSFHSAGKISTNPVIFAEQTGATVKEAKLLIAKLLTEGLLVPGKVYQATSPRMAAEHAKAAEAYARYKGLGQASGEKRKGKVLAFPSKE